MCRDDDNPDRVYVLIDSKYLSVYEMQDVVEMSQDISSGWKVLYTGNNKTVGGSNASCTTINVNGIDYAVVYGGQINSTQTTN